MLTSIADAFDSTNRPNDKLLINKGVLKVESRNCVEWFWSLHGDLKTIQTWMNWYRGGWVGWSVGGGDTLVSRESCHGVAVTEVVGRGGGESWGLRHGDLHGLQHFLHRLHRAFVLLLPTARHLGETERERGVDERTSFHLQCFWTYYVLTQTLWRVRIHDILMLKDKNLCTIPIFPCRGCIHKALLTCSKREKST